MSEQITLTVDGVATTVAAGTTGTDLFGDRRDVVVVRVDGELRDLAREVPDGATVEAVTLGEPDGLAVLRHSTAHVLAQAVQEVNPTARLGIGPPVTDGFYYDFDVEAPFTPEDLRELEKAMARIVKEGQTFRRVDVTEAQAREIEKDEPYKLELIGLKGDAGSEDGANVEVGLGGLTMYQNVRRDGTVAWQDLCRGPHLPSTRLIGNGFQLTRAITRDPNFADVPIIICTSKNQETDKVWGMRQGAKDYVVKPVDPDDLVAKIRAFG